MLPNYAKILSLPALALTFAVAGTAPNTGHAQVVTAAASEAKARVRSCRRSICPVDRSR